VPADRSLAIQSNANVRSPNGVGPRSTLDVPNQQLREDFNCAQNVRLFASGSCRGTTEAVDNMALAAKPPKPDARLI
jgi:hypothetical protein